MVADMESMADSNCLENFKVFMELLNYKQWLCLSYNEKIELSKYLPINNSQNNTDINETELDLYVKNIFDRIDDTIFENPLKMLYFKLKTEYWSEDNENKRELLNKYRENYIPLKKKEWAVTNLCQTLLSRDKFFTCLIKNPINNQMSHNSEDLLRKRAGKNEFHYKKYKMNERVEQIYNKILSKYIDLPQTNVKNLPKQIVRKRLKGLVKKYFTKKQISILRRESKKSIQSTTIVKEANKNNPIVFKSEIKNNTTKNITIPQSLQPLLPKTVTTNLPRIVPALKTFSKLPTKISPNLLPTKQNRPILPSLTTLSGKNTPTTVTNINKTPSISPNFTSQNPHPIHTSQIQIPKERSFTTSINDINNNHKTYGNFIKPELNIAIKLLPSMNDSSSKSSPFALLRNIMLSMPKFMITIEQAKNHVNDYMKQNPLLKWCKCPSLITSKILDALFYLSGKLAATQIQDFIPFVRYIQDSNEGIDGPTFVWIETNINIVSDSNLLILCQHWATFDSTNNPFYFIPQPDHQICINAHPQMSLHQQENQRFSYPSISYRYYEANNYYIVGPIKGIGVIGNPHTKVREHNLLTNNRPHYVTLSRLIKDSVARLPNGWGNRKMILDNLKKSQYFIKDFDPSYLLNVISSNLDKMNTEKDQAVKYDPLEKKWRYLHSTRTAEQFHTNYVAEIMFSNIKKMYYQHKKFS